MDDKRLKPAIGYLHSKRREDNTWKIDYRYKAEGYQVFDSSRVYHPWITHTLNIIIG